MLCPASATATCPLRESSDACLPEFAAPCAVCGRCLAGVKVVVRGRDGKVCGECYEVGK